MALKKKAIKEFAPLFIFLVILLAIVAFFIWESRSPVTIADTHVINMDKSMDRWEEIQGKAREARLTIKRWKAVDGSMITEDDVRKYEVSKLIARHTAEKKQPGVIGCFLSHKTLLKHLGDQWNMPWHAHLILEDDAYIPADFWNQWNKFSRELPADWDIVQIGVTYPNLKPVPGGVRLHTHSEPKGNVGAFAYLVKHRSLTKINDHLRYMYDPIDVMLRNKQNEWKIYFAWPEICPHDDHGKSTIVTEVSSK
jgi:GR25 family glycosyltransferase involved in LPS biosynthesis